MIPTLIIQTWFLGLLSLGIAGGAVYFGHEWQQRSWGWDPVLQQSVFAPDFGRNEETAMFAAAALLALIAIAGGPILKLMLRISHAAPVGSSDPRCTPACTEEKTIKRPDGSELKVQLFGPPEAQPIVMTHGWGLDAREWNYLRKELSDQFCLISWDEPGLGGSTRPANRDYSLENLASDLEAVLTVAGGKPAILLGHSIGGMIILTYCRLFPKSLGTSVAGLVLTHTTPTNPVRTTSGAAFYTAIEKPVLFPLMYLTIVFSPLLWLMNWLSYFNGSAHLSAMRGSFARTETWQQIDFAARFNLQASPAVLARGMMGMMRYDALAVLSDIKIPTLVVAGDKDSTTKPEASALIRRGIAGSELLILSPAKHLGLLEHHVKYAVAVREFAGTTLRPNLEIVV